MTNLDLRITSPTAAALAVTFAFAGIGCGASMDTAVTHPALMTDGDRYAAALEEATDGYAGAVAEAARFEYPDAEAAAEAAVALSAQRYDELLAESLRVRGLTAHGLRLYASRHPDFVRSPVAQTRERLVALREQATAIAARYPGHLDVTMLSLLETDEVFAAR
jgi:hypothetical protein